MDALGLLQAKIAAERRPPAIRMGEPRESRAFDPVPRRDALRESRAAMTRLRSPDEAS
jgi:NADH-quinone oxidoreductase subunit B